MLKATFSFGNTMGVPTMAKAMATPVNGLRLSVTPRLRPLLRIAGTFTTLPFGSLSGIADKLPEGSVMTISADPDRAAALAADVRPGNVYVFLGVPNTCWLTRVAMAPAPKAAELRKAACAPAPNAEARSPAASELEPTAVFCVPAPRATARLPTATFWPPSPLASE